MALRRTSAAAGSGLIGLISLYREHFVARAT
jgi:hypothetical protein